MESLSDVPLFSLDLSSFGSPISPGSAMVLSPSFSLSGVVGPDTMTTDSKGLKRKIEIEIQPAFKPPISWDATAALMWLRSPRYVHAKLVLFRTCCIDDAHLLN